MRQNYLQRLCILTFLLSSLSASASFGQSPKPVALFDGKTFDGWQGDTEKTWRVENGALTAGSLESRAPRNEFLATTKSFENFELTLKFKIEGTDRVNAGVQFRTRRIPNHHEVSGYQADIAPEYDGHLYDESRRRKFLASPKANVQKKAQESTGKDGWNTYRIRAEGDRIRLWLNGVPTVDYVEEDEGIEQSGIIAIQIHGGMQATIAYKDIAIVELPTHQPARASYMELPSSHSGLAGIGPLRHYEWFENLWKAKRAGWARQKKQDMGSIVFLGDSITQGWGDNLRGSFGDAKVANRGISGDTTRGMLLRLPEDVIDLNPTAVVMLMGTNDLEEGAKPESVAHNVELIIKALKTHNPKLPVVWCNVFPSSASKKRPAEKIKAVNRLVGELVKGDRQITVVDTWTLFANNEGDARKDEFPDLLHPNAKGYDMWAAALRPILATLGFLESDPPALQLEAGYRSLFNGRDLTGWGTRQYKTLKPKRDYDGKTTSHDQRYAAINGRLVVTTPPEGRKIQQLWTTQDFPDDFTLKLEFRATPNADSGIFVRGKQLQCRDYLLAGPYKKLKAYRPQDWNEVVIKVTGNSAHCTCNGEVLEAAMPIPENGPIGLEGDRGQMEYRNIRISQ